MKQADFGMVGIRYFLFVIVRFAPAYKRHFHIALSRAEPYFAYHDIIQYQFLTVADGQAVRSAGSRRLNINTPFAVLVGFGDILSVIP